MKGGDIKQVYTHHCLRCGHDWESKNEHPVKCPNPKCPSPVYWDRPRIRQPKGVIIC